MSTGGINCQQHHKAKHCWLYWTTNTAHSSNILNWGLKSICKLYTRFENHQFNVFWKQHRGQRPEFQEHWLIKMQKLLIVVITVVPSTQTLLAEDQRPTPHCQAERDTLQNLPQNYTKALYIDRVETIYNWTIAILYLELMHLFQFCPKHSSRCFPSWSTAPSLSTVLF